MTHGKASTFTPVHPFNFEEPASWAKTLEQLDFDSTHICFTKRSLLDFLKQIGVSVDPKYEDVQKLPKYASFGKFSKAATDEAVRDLIEAEIADPTSTKSPSATGKHGTTTYFESSVEHTDALSLAPPKPDVGAGALTREGEEGEGLVISHTDREEISGVVQSD